MPATEEECIMAHQKRDKIHDGSFVVDTSGNTYSVDKNLTIIATGHEGKTDEIGAINEDGNKVPVVHDNTYNIDGRLIGYSVGIQTFGQDDRINIGTSGRISGEYAVDVEGDNSTVVNRGSITSTQGYGVYEAGENSTFRNLGTLTGFTAFADESSDGVKIVNEAKGQIYGLDQGVYLGTGAGQFINHGLVYAAAGDYAVGGAGGSNLIRNDGVINGTVDLGDGDDVLDTRGGTIHGTIFGGAGDDILMTGNANDKLVESVDGGADTVGSTVSYKLSDNVETLMLLGKRDINGAGTDGAETLIGNDGDNRLVGGGGFDTLVGGKGDDVLTGGLSAANRFVFSTGDGHDTIMDYKENLDILDFTSWTGIESVADVVSHAHDQSQGGNDAVLIKSGHDSVLMIGFSKAELSDAGFEYQF
jgi:Ca2+-binding RTX toxin-like protein